MRRNFEKSYSFAFLSFRALFVLFCIFMAYFAVSDSRKIGAVSAETGAVRIEFNGETVYKTTTLTDAFTEAQRYATSEENPAVITVFQDIFISAQTVDANKYIVLKGESVENIKVKRESAAKVDLFTVNGTLTLTDITVDGGAIWEKNGAYTEFPFDADNVRGLNSTKSLFNVSPSGKLILGSGSVLQNNLSAKGGAISVSGGCLELNGGSVRANKAANGGAVYMTSGASFILNDGIIEGNYATANGGAVYNFCNSGGLFLYGGAITNNAADTLGGGVYLSSNAILKLKNSPAVSSNRVNGRAQNVYIAGCPLQLAGELSGIKRVGVTLAGSYSSSAFLNGASQTEAEFFFSDDNSKEVYLEGNDLKLRNAPVATVNFDSGIEGVNIDNVTVWDTETKLASPILSRTGYLLLGWFNGETEWDFENYVAASMTLAAKWELKPPAAGEIAVDGQVKTEFEFEADLNTYELSVTIAEHELPSVTYEYAWFKGNVEISKTPTINIGAKEDCGSYSVRARAKCGGDISGYIDSQPIELKSFYTVSFLSDGATASPIQKTYEQNEELASPVLNKTGYALSGWFNGESQWNFDEYVTESLTLTATWALNAPTVAKITVGGQQKTEFEFEADLKTYILSVTAAHELAFVNYDYEWFKGGEKVADTAALSVGAKEDCGSYSVRVRAKCGGDISGYINSQPIEIKTFYIVNFTAEGAAAPAPQKFYSQNSKLESPILIKTGFILLGWYCGDLKWNFNTDTVNSSITLSARHELIPPAAVKIKSDKEKNTAVDGDPITISAEFSHPLSGSWSYKWFKRGKNVVEIGAKGNTLTLSKLSEAGVYFCRAELNCEGQIKSADSADIEVHILARELRASSPDKNPDDGLDATLNSGKGIDPNASLHIEEGNIGEVYAGQILKTGQSITKIYSIGLKADSAELELPEQSTILMSLGIESGGTQISKILLIKDDGTWQEVEIRNEDGKLLFAVNALGSIVVISETKPSVPPIAGGGESGKNDGESGNTGGNGEALNIAADKAYAKEIGKAKIERIFHYTAIGAVCVLAAAFAAFIIRSRKKKKRVT